MWALRRISVGRLALSAILVSIAAVGLLTNAPTAQSQPLLGFPLDITYQVTDASGVVTTHRLRMDSWNQWVDRIMNGPAAGYTEIATPETGVKDGYESWKDWQTIIAPDTEGYWSPGAMRPAFLPPAAVEGPGAGRVRASLGLADGVDIRATDAGGGESVVALGATGVPLERHVVGGPTVRVTSIAPAP